MEFITYEGIVEDGHIVLPPDVVLPENAKVYVMVPEIVVELPPPPPLIHIRSPRLSDPSKADFFKLEVCPEDDYAKE